MCDGGATAEYVRGIKLDIVLDVVVVDLRAREEAAKKVVADAEAEVLHKVVAVGVVDAATCGGAAGRHGRQVEARGGNSDAGHDVQAKLFSNTGLIERVYVGEKGPVGFSVERIAGLLTSPGGFDVNPKATLLEADIVSADAIVGATFFLRLPKVHRVIVGGKSLEGAAAEHDIHFLDRGLGRGLGGGEAGKKKQRAGRCE